MSGRQGDEEEKRRGRGAKPARSREVALLPSSPDLIGGSGVAVRRGGSGVAATTDPPIKSGDDDIAVSPRTHLYCRLRLDRGAKCRGLATPRSRHACQLIPRSSRGTTGVCRHALFLVGHVSRLASPSLSFAVSSPGLLFSHSPLLLLRPGPALSQRGQAALGVVEDPGGDVRVASGEGDEVRKKLRGDGLFRRRPVEGSDAGARAMGSASISSQARSMGWRFVMRGARWRSRLCVVRPRLPS